jgi:hypothetical protein
MNNFYDNCKQIADFELTLNIFFTNLSKKLPEFDHDIKKALKHFNKSDKTEYITKLIKNMEPHIDYIAKYDEGIFSTDYSKDIIKLIPGLNIKDIFLFINDNTGDNENQFSAEACLKTKKTIFTYLQSIYLSGQMALNKINDFNNIINKQKDLLFNMFKNLNLDETIKTKLENLEDDEETTSGIFDKIKELFESGVLKDIFGDLINEFKPLMNIAQDIFKELNEDKVAPENISKNIGDKVKKVMKSFIIKIKEKLVSGEISKDIIIEKVKNSLKKLKTIFPNFDFDKYFNPNADTNSNANANANTHNHNQNQKEDSDTNTDKEDKANADNISNMTKEFLNIGKDLLGKYSDNENIKDIFNNLSSNLDNIGDIYKNIEQDDSMKELLESLLETTETTETTETNTTNKAD